MGQRVQQPPNPMKLKTASYREINMRVHESCRMIAAPMDIRACGETKRISKRINASEYNMNQEKMTQMTQMLMN